MPTVATTGSPPRHGVPLANSHTVPSFSCDPELTIQTPVPTFPPYETETLVYIIGYGC